MMPRWWISALSMKDAWTEVLIWAVRSSEDVGGGRSMLVGEPALNVEDVGEVGVVVALVD